MNDVDLAAELIRLAAGERQSTVALIVHLAEFDERRLYEGAGFTSLFGYCRTILRLAEGAAYNRIAAARALRRWPMIPDMLLAGSLSLTTVRLLAPHLTSENHRDLLAAASGRGKRETEELLARWFPKPDVQASVRKVPTGQASPVLTVPESCVPGGGERAGASVAVVPRVPAAVPTTSAPPLRPGVVRPLAPERYEVRFTASSESRALLRRAQDLLAHAVPSGDIAQIFERAMRLLVADLEGKKCGAVARPRQVHAESTDSRHIPAAVRRVVWARDRGCCAFVAASGRRCLATRFLEFHHVRPHAAGGPATVENIQLRCRAHNGHEVDLFYGPGIRRTGRRPSAGAATRPGSSEAGT